MLSRVAYTHNIIISGEIANEYKYVYTRLVEQNNKINKNDTRYKIKESKRLRGNKSVL